jgi:hypothetical protein
VLRTLGLAGGGEIAAVDLESGVMGPDHADSPKPQHPMLSDPIAPMPHVAAERKSSAGDTFDRIPPPEPSSPPSNGGSRSGQSAPSSLPSATPPQSVTKSSVRARAPLDSKVTQASGDALSKRAPSAAPAEKPEPPALLDSLATLASPSEASTGTDKPQSAGPSPSLKATEIAGGEWANVVKKMQTLGVSRFSVDGEPGGRVVFACLIPLAGRQAVSQRFESSGDDVVQAARAALRRVTLWRATQVQEDNPSPSATTKAR